MQRAILQLLSPNGSGNIISVLSAKPSGRDFSVEIKQHEKIGHTQISKFAGYIDADTGEVLGDPVRYIRAIWARKKCEEFGGWELADLISALPIEGIGLQTAIAIASVINTWDNFLEALRQLQSIKVPISRNQLDEWAGEKLWRENRLEEFLPGHPSSLYSEQLATLMMPGVTGPSVWQNMRTWIDSPGANDNIRTLLTFGRPLQPPSKIFTDKIVAFSGTFENVSRTEAASITEKLGGRVVGLPKYGMTMLVVGVGASEAKLKAARKSGAAIVSEQQWLEMINENKKAARRNDVS